MARVHGDGTEKLSLVFIAKSKMPKRFNGKTENDRGLIIILFKILEKQ